MKKEILRMERVTYIEDGITCLRDFSMQILGGEILGLHPINGHGLSGFISLLESNHPLNDGYIYYNGEMVNSWKGALRAHNKISVIGAHNRLVDDLTVIDNIFVLREGFHQELLHVSLLEAQLRPFLSEIGIALPLDTPVGNLSSFERVIVELLREVVLGHRLLVLNEIETLLSRQEADELYRILRHYAKKGFAVLYIGNHYEEMLKICERTMWFSSGRILRSIVRPEELPAAVRPFTWDYEKMIRYRLESHQRDSEKKVLHIQELCGSQMSPLSFEVYQEECLTLQITDDAAYQDFQDLLLGSRLPKSGEIFMNGSSCSLLNNPHIAVIRENATDTMLFPGMSYLENLCISFAERVPSVWRDRKIRKSIQREYAPLLGEEVFSLPVERLSSRQKYQLVYTRILLAKPSVVFCIQPFKGADLSHRMLIWQMLEMLLNHHIAVVILAVNISDALSISDRLLIVTPEGQREFLQKDFASLPDLVPWMSLYR
ncbi:MAG: ATP-binding cassette domain-containing protein [Eubacteriales bacterium]|nr:ATP-binding cassette domain-containing protein [Eubacteriales bacterium]